MRAGLPVVLLSALCAACGDTSSGPPTASVKASPEVETPAAPPAGVQIVSLEYRTRVTSLETTGKVQFNEDRLVRVHAPVTGRVLEVLASPGDVVEPGRRLLVLDSPDLGTAKSDYAKAVADAERAEAALRLARELFEVKAIAQKEIREAENDYRKTLAERDRAASRLRTLGVREEQFKNIAARADASTSVVMTAPKSGVVVERNVSSGQVVAYGQSDTPVNLFVVADLSTMWVVADVYEPDVPKVHLGQAVTVTPPCCPGERYEGRLVYVADSIDKETRTLKVRVVVPNRGHALKAEMFVKVTIATGTSQVLALPQSAVHREDGQTYVLVAKAEGGYERRLVKLGDDLDGFVEIREGIAPEDRVVSGGSILLKKTTK